MKKTLAAIAAVFLLGQSCIQFNSAGADGGVYRSGDFGNNWEQKTFVSQEQKRTLTISNTNIVQLVIDPKNTKTVYVGTRENGMFVSYDAGEKWEQMLTAKGEVRAIAVDPKNKDVLYASIAEKIVKSTDAGKTWKLIYSEPRGEYISEIQVDGFDTKRVYAGTTGGQVIKSVDTGQSWQVIGSFDSKVLKILINPKDTRIVYVATYATGLQKSSNGGAEWKNLLDKMAQFEGSHAYQDMAINLNEPNRLIYASEYGLLRSNDNGESWESINLLTPPRSVIIYSVAINYKNSNEMVYGTGQNLFKTSDGGKTWISRPLPTKRIPNRLVPDPANPGTVFMGALKLK